MTVNPQRASVVIDLLESATRNGSLEKQEAAAILSSWIEEQKHQPSGGSSPSPQDSQPSPESPTSAGSSAGGGGGSRGSPLPPHQTTPLPRVRSFFRPLSRQGSIPRTPPAAASAAAARRQQQFAFPPSPPPPPPPSPTMQEQRQRQQLRRHRQRSMEQPMRGILSMFSACASGDNGDGDGPADAPAAEPPRQPPLPPLPPLPTTVPATTPLCPSPPGSDAYALYDANNGQADQNTYSYIDELEVAEVFSTGTAIADSGSSTPTPGREEADATCGTAAAAAAKAKAKAAVLEDSSPTGTSDSGIYGSGYR